MLQVDGGVISGLCTIVKVYTGIAISRSLVHTAIKKSGMKRKKARMCGAPKSLQAKTEDFIRQRKQRHASVYRHHYLSLLAFRTPAG